MLPMVSILFNVPAHSILSKRLTYFEESDLCVHFSTPHCTVKSIFNQRTYFLKLKDKAFQKIL